MGLFKGELSHSTLLPERQNDMIFSVVCEESGFIGAFILMLLFTIGVANRSLLFKTLSLFLHHKSLSYKQYASLLLSFIVL